MFQIIRHFIHRTILIQGNSTHTVGDLELTIFSGQLIIHHFTVQRCTIGLQCLPHTVLIYLIRKIQLQIFLFQCFFHLISFDDIADLSHVHRLPDRVVIIPGNTQFFCCHTDGHIIHMKNDLITGNLIHSGLQRLLCLILRHTGQIHTFRINMIQNLPLSLGRIVRSTGIECDFIRLCLQCRHIFAVFFLTVFSIICSSCSGSLCVILTSVSRIFTAFTLLPRL